MVSKIRVIVIGLGQIGLDTCKLILKKDSLQLLGVVDIDPKKAGKDLGEFLGKKKLGIKIYDDLRFILKEFQPEVTIITSKSKLKEIANDIILCIENHSSVISSCEELFYPLAKHKKLFEEIDSKAKENFTHVLGTGVNPGFVMDILPLFLTSTCAELKSLKITRKVDLNKRRQALQQKMGLGLTTKEFNKFAKENELGHVGLSESANFISDFLKIKIDRWSEIIKPVLASRNIKTKHYNIKKGNIAGIKQSIFGLKNNKKIISLELEISCEVENSYDEIIVEGIPPINMRIENGIFGDTATTAIMVNVIPNLLHARYGLITMKDLSIPSFLSPITK